jgi:hypothetical protein
LEGGHGDAPAGLDLYGFELPGRHEFVDGGPADTEDGGRIFGRDEQLLRRAGGRAILAVGGYRRKIDEF